MSYTAESNNDKQLIRIIFISRRLGHTSLYVTQTQFITIIILYTYSQIAHRKVIARTYVHYLLVFTSVCVLARHMSNVLDIYHYTSLYYIIILLRISFCIYSTLRPATFFSFITIFVCFFHIYI